MSFRLFPISAFPSTGGNVFPYVLETEVNSFWVEGMGVVASLASDAAIHYVYHIPAIIPAGTAKLEVLALASQASGLAKFNPKWKSIALGEDFDLAVGSLNAEGTQTLTWLNEEQLVTLAGATGGTFTLSFNSQGPTGTIAYDAVAGTVQTALEGLSNIASGDVSVTGNAGGPYTVEFDQAYSGQNVVSMTADGALLTGTTPTVDVTVSQEATANSWLRSKVTLDADTVTVDEFVSLRFVLETSGWTLDNTSIWLPAIIWE